MLSKYTESYLTTMYPELQQLRTEFSGRPAVIIGGGNSLNEFDFSPLDSFFTISLNSSISKYKSTAVLFTDLTWVSQFGDKYLSANQPKYRFFASSSAPTITHQGLKYGSHRSMYLKITGGSGVDWDIGNVRGNNSGSYALNLCANLGFKRIYLLGYDMGLYRGKTHFHDDYDNANRVHIYQSFSKNVCECVAGLKDSGIKVFNVNPVRSLPCVRRAKKLPRGHNDN